MVKVNYTGVSFTAKGFPMIIELPLSTGNTITFTRGNETVTYTTAAKDGAFFFKVTVTSLLKPGDWTYTCGENTGILRVVGTNEPVRWEHTVSDSVFEYQIPGQALS